MAVSRPFSRFSVTDVLALFQSSGGALTLHEIQDHLRAVYASGHHSGRRQRDGREYMLVQRRPELFELLADLESIGIIQGVGDRGQHLEDRRWRLNEGWSRGENSSVERDEDDHDRDRDRLDPPPPPPPPPPEPPGGGGDGGDGGDGGNDGGGDGFSGLREVLAHPYLFAVSPPDLDEAIDRALVVLP